MKNKIFVVTNPENGWDCVLCIITANSEEEAIEIFIADGYTYDEDRTIFHEKYKILGYENRT